MAVSSSEVMSVGEKKKLESNFGIYLKVAEREFLGKNFKSALKSFKNAHEIAKRLGNVENMIKTLDTQASCHEQMGNSDEAISIALKMISNYKTSPIGYLRMGKLKRLKKEFEEAEEVYKIGISKANKRDAHYNILDKQLKAVQTVLTSLKGEDDSLSKFQSTEEVKNQFFGKGHLLSISSNVLNQICSLLPSNTLANLALTCNFGFKLVLRGLMIGSFGQLTDLRSLKSSQLYSKLMKDFSVLSKYNQFSTFSVNSESSTLLFLIFLKKNMAKLTLKAPKITNLSIGPLQPESMGIFRECLTRGLNLSRLKIDLSGTMIQNSLSFKNLKELVLINNNNNANGDPKIDAPGLISLTITGSSGVRSFSNCKNLIQLIYPNESDFNSFNSKKIILANLKYEQSVTMRPRPIRYLCLNGFINASNGTTTFGCIDLTQYSYEFIKVLHLEGFTLNSSINNDQELIKSSSWYSLKCLRLTKLMFNSPVKDLSWILSKCPKSLKVLEIVSIPLAGFKDFNTNENGIWLFDLIFNLFPNLEHLIFGDLVVGPSAINLLSKKFVNKNLKRLKVFGFLNIQSNLYNFDLLFQTYMTNYKNSIKVIVKNLIYLKVKKHS